MSAKMKEMPYPATATVSPWDVPSDSIPWRHTGGHSAFGSPPCHVSIIAVGSTHTGALDSLLMEGSIELTVVDDSATALDDTKQRLGSLSKYIAWKHAHVLEAELPQNAYDVWFDQTWYAQLSSEVDRQRYMAQVKRTLRPGGTAIIDGQVTRNLEP